MDQSLNQPFGPNEEKAIISLAFSSPEFYSSVGQHLDVKYFNNPAVQYVFAIIDMLYEQHEIVPTREMVKDIALKRLTVDDEYQDVIDIIDRESDPREIPVVKDTLIGWAREKAYGLLYSKDAMDAYDRGDFDSLGDIVENAQRIVDVSQTGDQFFKTYQTIFDTSTEVKLTTGFKDLDRWINEGGPTKGDVFVWMAPTGIGKTMILVNTGAMCFRANQKVLHITLEISTHKTKLRYSGVFTRMPISQRYSNKDRMVERIDRERAGSSGDIIIYEFPPDEISVDTIHQVIKWLKRTKGWNPDVVIIDYLELMVSRRSAYNKEDYIKQKSVSTELRGLAKKENVLLFTATQTNREVKKDKGKNGPGDGGNLIDVNRAAESYGKMMPSDYVVSLNQTPDEYKQNRIRFYIAKNRNGPRFRTLSAKVNYDTMVVQVDPYKAIGG